MSERTRYLVALYVAEREVNPPVPAGHLADALGRSPSATTEMLQRLDAEGLVDNEPYEGATLTDEGRETAAELDETYRTLARFFRDVLDLAEYDEEALRLAGTVSPSVADRLAATLLDDGDEADPEETQPPVSPFPGGDPG